MKTSTKPKTGSATTKTPPLMAIVVGVLAIICLVWGGVALYGAYNTKKAAASEANYAEETAKPLEAALALNGATKKCGYGDAGRGTDNKSPGYQAVFETGLTMDGAAALVTKVAADNGFKLSQQKSPYDYIDWYSDLSSRNSTYSDLEAGQIRLAVNLYSGGDNLGCTDGTKVTYDANRAAILMSVTLPAFKR